MLVLSRRLGEEIVIGGNIRVTVVAVQGKKVRLGVNAPESVCVDRQEVHDRRQSWVDDGESERTLARYKPSGGIRRVHP
jgi:carbon storage regulator